MFLWFSYGFPMVFLWFTTSSPGREDGVSRGRGPRSLRGVGGDGQCLGAGGAAESKRAKSSMRRRDLVNWAWFCGIDLFIDLYLIYLLFGINRLYIYIYNIHMYVNGVHVYICM